MCVCVCGVRSSVAWLLRSRQVDVLAQYYLVFGFCFMIFGFCCVCVCVYVCGNNAIKWQYFLSSMPWHLCIDALPRFDTKAPIFGRFHSDVCTYLEYIHHLLYSHPSFIATHTPHPPPHLAIHCPICQISFSALHIHVSCVCVCVCRCTVFVDSFSWSSPNIPFT